MSGRMRRVSDAADEGRQFISNRVNQAMRDVASSPHLPPQQQQQQQQQQQSSTTVPLQEQQYQWQQAQQNPLPALLRDQPQFHNVQVEPAPIDISTWVSTHRQIILNEMQQLQLLIQQQRLQEHQDQRQLIGQLQWQYGYRQALLEYYERKVQQRQQQEQQPQPLQPPGEIQHRLQSQQQVQQPQQSLPPSYNNQP